MGGRNQQRVKNNAKPSSSGRHAQRLGGSEQLVGFGDLGFNSSSSSGSLPRTQNYSLDANIRALLKRMTKKDATTKSKATREFTELCSDLDDSQLTLALPFWCHLYVKLANDVDNRVRESSHVALQTVLLRLRRAAVPHMCEIVPVWMCCLNDAYPPAASAARRTLQTVFPTEEKRTALMNHCRDAVLRYVQEGLLQHTVNSFSDPTMFSQEDMDARYIRLLTGCLSALQELLEMVTDLVSSSSSSADANSSDESPIHQILSAKKFYKLAKHSDVLVRRCWFSLVCCVCSRHAVLAVRHASQLCPGVLHALHESDPCVIADVWQAAVCVVTAVPECWQYVNVRSAVLPHVWSLLRAGGSGCAGSVYPSLIVLLSCLPQDVAGSHVLEFNRLFFTGLRQGLEVERVVQSTGELTVVIRTLVECGVYVIRRQQCKGQVSNIILDQWLEVLEDLIGGRLVGVASTGVPALAAGVTSLLSPAESDSESLKAAETALWSRVEVALLERHLNDVPSSLRCVDFLVSASCCGAEGRSAQQGAAPRRVRFSPADNTASSFVAPEAAADTTVGGGSKPPSADITVDGGSAPPAVNSAEDDGSVVRVCASALRCTRAVTHDLLRRVDSHSQLVARPLRSLLARLPDQLLPTLDAAAVEHACSCLVELAFSLEMAPDVHTPTLLTALYCRLPPPQQRRVLQQVSQLSCTWAVTRLLTWALGSCDRGETLTAWIISDDLRRLLTSVVACRSDRWRHLPEILQLLTDLPSIHGADLYADLSAKLTEQLAGPTADQLQQLVSPAAERLQLLAPLLGLHCRDGDALLALHAAGLSVGVSQVALLCLVKGALSSGPTGAALLRQAVQYRSLSAALSVVSVAGVAVLDELPIIYAPSGADRRAAQVRRVLQRRLSVRPPTRPAEAAQNDSFELVAGREYPWEPQQASFQLQLLASVCQPADPSSFEVVQRCLVTHLVPQLVAQVVTAGSYSPEQLPELLTVMDSQHSHSLCCELFEMSSESEDGIEAECLAAVLTVLNESPDTYIGDVCTTPPDLVLATLPLLPDAHLTTGLHWIVSAEADVDWARLAEAAGCLSLLAARHSADWLLTELGPVLSRLLDSLVARNEQDRMPSAWPVSESLGRMARSSDPSGEFVFYLSLFRLLDTVLAHCSVLLTRQHWDFVLLTLSSWIAATDTVKPDDGGCMTLLYGLCRVACSVHDVISINGLQLLPDLHAEWHELFLVEWSRALSVLLVSVTSWSLSDPLVSAAVDAVCEFVGNAPLSVVSDHCLPTLVDPELDEPNCHLSDKLTILSSWTRRLMATQHRSVRITAWSIMDRMLPIIAEADESRPAQEGPSGDMLLELPAFFTATLRHCDGLVTALLGDLTPGQPCVIEPDSDSHTVVLTYLLTWHLTLTYTSHLSVERRVMTAETIRRDGLLDRLLVNLFHLMPEVPALPVDSDQQFSSTYFQLSPTHTTADGAVCDVHHWSCLVYAASLRRLPVLARSWLLSCDRAQSQRACQLTAEYLSPLLLAEEFTLIATADRTFNNMVVCARASSREVSAVYTVDGTSTELLVTLPLDFPLGKVTAEVVGKRVGVTGAQWNMWSLQLISFLSHQNGRILDGLMLWKQNVDKRFQGVEECNICFYVLHGSNYQLPRLNCRTCRKPFHPACLYKWFSTSSKSTCPMCRQPF